ncbi:MAG TPA: alginate lyase family protein, partial [Candidatus Eisenbacteria bacterium]|nr:alginate lyase family protein [Candidatus Eisenbacteria bacterium]
LYREREETLWDDHITAMRALLLCDAWAAAARSGAASTGDLRSLGAALARHAERLALPAFYRPGHNHGLTQAFALLAVAAALHAHPSAPRWSRLARERLEGQMAGNVSEEGVHLEHSPYYHFFVLRQFLGARRLAGAAGTPLGAAFEERLHRMLDAGASMIEPGGGLAPLGDTWQGAPILLTDEELDAFAPDRAAALRLARSAGGPVGGSVLYEGGGLAVIRSRTAADESDRAARYLAVRLSVHPTSHVHSDAASFTLHAYGRPLLVDSGGPYGYGDPLRHGYFTTTGAHNTVVVDGGNQKPGPATIHRWEPNGAIQILDAEHGNYAGVRHRRSLFLVRDRFVLLVDRLESGSPHRYEQRFHFAAHLEVRREGRDAVAADPGGGASLRLVPLGGGTGELSLHRGDGGPDGPSAWICTGDRERVASWGAVCAAEGPDAWFATLLAPSPGTSPPSVSVDRLDEGASGAIRIRVATEGLRAVLRLAGGAAPSIEEEAGA